MENLSNLSLEAGTVYKNSLNLGKITPLQTVQQIKILLQFENTERRWYYASFYLGQVSRTKMSAVLNKNAEKVYGRSAEKER